MPTPWFDDDTTPARKGYYDTRRPNLYGVARVARRTSLGGIRREQPDVITIRLYWTGTVWLASHRSLLRTAHLFCQRREWRGLFSHEKT